MTGHFRPMGPNSYPRPINRRPEANRRLDSWKEIATFLDCGERTVKRWETERGLPVHRMPGSGRGRVSAYTAELRRSEKCGVVVEASHILAVDIEREDHHGGAPAGRPPHSQHREILGAVIAPFGRAFFTFQQATSFFLPAALAMASKISCPVGLPVFGPFG